MKQYYSLALFISLILVGCGDSSTVSSSDSSSSETPLPTLVVSKLITATASKNNIIELYNPTQESIALMGITLDFYSNGSQEMTAQIPLEGTLNGESYFVLGSASNEIEGMLELMDYVHPTGILP